MMDSKVLEVYREIFSYSGNLANLWLDDSVNGLTELSEQGSPFSIHGISHRAQPWRRHKLRGKTPLRENYLGAEWTFQVGLLLLLLLCALDNLCVYYAHSFLCPSQGFRMHEHCFLFSSAAGCCPGCLPLKPMGLTEHKQDITPTLYILEIYELGTPLCTVLLLLLPLWKKSLVKR